MTTDRPTITLNLPTWEDRLAGKSTFWHAVLSGDALVEIEGASDRIMAIVGAAQVDESVRDLIRSVMVDGEDRNKALEPEGLLGSFMARVKMASALGLIGADIRNDLAMIARIRNLFAHRVSGVTFLSPEVVKLCSKLRTPDAWTRKTGSGGRPGDGVLVSSHHGDGRIHAIYLDFFERDEKVKEPRWRYEAAVQMISYALVRLHRAPPAPATL